MVEIEPTEDIALKIKNMTGKDSELSFEQSLGILKEDQKFIKPIRIESIKQMKSLQVTFKAAPLSFEKESNAEPLGIPRNLKLLSFIHDKPCAY